MVNGVTIYGFSYNKYGCNEYTSKPVDIERFLEIVKRQGLITCNKQNEKGKPIER